MEVARIDELEREAHRQLLLVATSHPESDVETVWRAIPRNPRQHASLIAVYARSLIRKDAMDAAEHLLLPALRHDAADELFEAYGELHGQDALRYLSQAETWLKAYPQNGALLLCLTKLSLAANLPGKAREYAERCVRQNPHNEVYAELTLIMERLGDEARAREYCHRSLELQKARNEGPRTESLFLPF
jgi:HemY protein